MDGNINRSRIALICALALGGICLWQLNESVSAFFDEKALAEQKYARCLEKIELQAAIETNRPSARNQIWPCWHQQLTVKRYTEKGALIASLTPPNDKESGFYVATLFVLAMAGLGALKQR